MELCQQYFPSFTIRTDEWRMQLSYSIKEELYKVAQHKRCRCEAMHSRACLYQANIVLPVLLMIYDSHIATGFCLVLSVSHAFLALVKAPVATIYKGSLDQVGVASLIDPGSRINVCKVDVTKRASCGDLLGNSLPCPISPGYRGLSNLFSVWFAINLWPPEELSNAIWTNLSCRVQHKIWTCLALELTWAELQS